MNRTAVPLLCLITGGVLGVCGGYQWRAQMDHATAHVASDASEPQTGTEAKAGSKSELAANISSGVTASAPAASLESEVDDLLANYDPRRLDALLAMEWGEDQLHAGLVKLSSKTRGTNHKLELKAALYRLWAKRDASGAWQAALVDPDSANSGTLLGGVAREMATKEPMSAADLALKLGMGARRGDVLADVFDEWGKHDVAAAVAWWNAHPNMPGDTDVIDAALKHAAGTQPELAAQQALKVRGVEGRRSALWTVVGAWAQKDFDAAFQWVQTIPDAEMRKTHLAQAMGVLASSDPQKALDVAGRLQDEAMRSEAMSGAISTLLERSPEKALDYVAAHPSEALIKEIQVWFPSRTKNLTLDEQKSLLSRISDETARTNIISNLVSRQADKGNYSEAIEMINEMADASSRSASIRDVSGKWAKSDPQAAGDWLGTFGDASDRDDAVRGYSRAVAATDPMAAMEWAGTLSTQEIKEGAMMDIAVQWLRKDRGTAERWLAAQDWLNDEERADMLRNAASRFGTIGYGAHSRER